MRRGVPAAGVVLVLGPLVLLAFLIAPHDGPVRRSGDTAEPATLARSRGAAAAATPVVSAAARTLLERAAAAPRATSYTGVQFVSAWSPGSTTSHVLDVAHRAGGGTTLRADGTAGSPAAAVTVQSSGSPSVLSLSAVELLGEHYSLAVTGTAQVAGRLTDVVEVTRPGALATAPPAARFWVDRVSGLMLRREIYDENGMTVRAGSFVSVALQESASSDSPDTPADGAVETAWTASYDTAALVRMRQQGWYCPTSLPGALTLVDARRSTSGIVHLSYSDGLSVVSVFEQRGDLDERGMSGHRRTTIAGHAVYQQDSVPTRLVWTSGSRVFTVVADAPQRTVDLVVAALPHEPVDGDSFGGAAARVGRGLDRVASWFDPFG